MFFGLFTQIAEARTKVLKPIIEFRLNAPNDALAESVVKRALEGRHWVVLPSKMPNTTQAMLGLRGHSVTIELAWTKESVKITYITSEDMSYEIDEDGTQHIDRYYYRWVKLLKRDMIKFLGRAPTALPDVNDDDDENEADIKSTPAAAVNSSAPSPTSETPNQITPAE